MTTPPKPVERCGYTVEPVLNRDGSFNPHTGSMRISKDSAHTVFPARLFADLADVDDDVVQGILASLFYMPDDWQPPQPAALAEPMPVALAEPMPVADTELDDEIEQILGRFLDDSIERVHARNAICKAISARGFDVYARRA